MTLRFEVEIIPDGTASPAITVRIPSGIDPKGCQFERKATSTGTHAGLTILAPVGTPAPAAAVAAPAAPTAFKWGTPDAAATAADEDEEEKAEYAGGFAVGKPIPPVSL